MRGTTDGDPNCLYLRFWITVFGFVRLQGGPLVLAYGAQAVVSTTAILLLVRALLSRPPGVRSGTAEVAAIAACIPFCSPFMLEYDLVILAVPMIWLLTEALSSRLPARRGHCAGGRLCRANSVRSPLLDNVMKISATAAAALLFAMVLRRMTQSAAVFRNVTLVPRSAPPLQAEGSCVRRRVAH